MYITDAFIQNGTITTAKIGDAQIDNAKIADLAVDVAKIANATITAAKIADATITAAKITDATITAAKIANATITAAQIADASITNAKIGNVIQSNDYVAGSAGWAIDKSGTAEFSSTSIRGQLSASQVDTAGLLIKDANGVVILNSGGSAGKFGSAPTATQLNSTVNVLDGSALPGGISSTYFYVRWEGFVKTATAGTYTIGVSSDDGCNLVVGSTQLIANLTAGQPWAGALTFSQSGQMYLEANVSYPIVLEWQQGGGQYNCQLLWTPPGGSIAVIPSANLSTSTSSSTGNLRSSWWQGNSTHWYPTGAARGLGLVNKLDSANISTYIADLAVDTLQVAGNAITTVVAGTAAGGFATNGLITGSGAYNSGSSTFTATATFPTFTSSANGSGRIFITLNRNIVSLTSADVSQLAIGRAGGIAANGLVYVAFQKSYNGGAWQDVKRASNTGYGGGEAYLTPVVFWPSIIDTVPNSTNVTYRLLASAYFTSSNSYAEASEITYSITEIKK